jgi:beta-carotene ketolase (CrtW type)
MRVAAPTPAATGPEGAARVLPPDAAAASRVGLLLAAMVIGAWVVVQAWGVAFHPLDSVAGLATAPLLVALQTWLNVGLFIVAHDCMHGSLAPGRPRLNRAIGRASLFLYAGFSYDRLLPAHHAHHRHPGSAQDPDFSAEHPRGFWRWYLAFVLRYFGWRQLLVLMAAYWTMVGLLGLALPRVLLFWALPAIVSSAQLFYFGTYLPHRHGDDAFVDRHNARSSGFRYLASLLTCFHFGHHHEHHLHPGVPWWRLPAVAKARR